jgi:hypothetical protein
MKVLGTARENAAVDERDCILNVNAAVAEDVLNAGIDRHNAIERARKWIGIQLHENGGLFGHSEGPMRGEAPGMPWQVAEAVAVIRCRSDRCFLNCAQHFSSKISHSNRSPCQKWQEKSVFKIV